MRQPGVEPGSPAWKAGILTVGLLTRRQRLQAGQLSQPASRQIHPARYHSYVAIKAV